MAGYATRARPLDWFALLTTILVVGAFFYPGQFYFHFVAFLVPFLALAVALPVSRLVSAVRLPAERAGQAARCAGQPRAWQPY